jgi:hypothetical protein
LSVVQFINWFTTALRFLYLMLTLITSWYLLYVLSPLFVPCIHPLAFLLGRFPLIFPSIIFLYPLRLRVWPIHLVLLYSSTAFPMVRSSSTLLFTYTFLILFTHFYSGSICSSTKFRRLLVFCIPFRWSTFPIHSVPRSARMFSRTFSSSVVLSSLAVVFS